MNNQKKDISGRGIDISGRGIDISGRGIDISSVTVSREINNKINNKINDYEQGDPLLKNIKVNYIFYISILISVYFICKAENKNFIIGIITFIIVSMNGYFIHMISHFTNYTKIYDSLDNYITRNRFTSFIIRNMCRLVDFHDEIHHDSSINKKFKNAFIEFILNFITQCSYLLIVIFISKRMSYWIVALWGLSYSTIHIINYEFVKPETHMLHHVDKHTNYGLDIWDVLFNSKYNNNNYKTENINHGAINVFILTGIILYFLRNKS